MLFSVLIPLYAPFGTSLAGKNSYLGAVFLLRAGNGGGKDSFSAARPGFPGHSHPNMVNMKQFLLRGSLGVARCWAFFSCCPLRRWRTADSRSPAAGSGEGGWSAAFGAAGGERKQPRLRLSGLSDTKGCRARLAAGPLPQPAASDSPASESSL